MDLSLFAILYFKNVFIIILKWNHVSAQNQIFYFLEFKWNIFVLLFLVFVYFIKNLRRYNLYSSLWTNTVHCCYTKQGVHSFTFRIIEVDVLSIILLVSIKGIYEWFRQNQNVHFPHMFSCFKIVSSQWILLSIYVVKTRGAEFS